MGRRTNDDNIQFPSSPPYTSLPFSPYPSHPPTLYHSHLPLPPTPPTSTIPLPAYPSHPHNSLLPPPYHSPPPTLYHPFTTPLHPHYTTPSPLPPTHTMPPLHHSHPPTPHHSHLHLTFPSDLVYCRSPQGKYVGFTGMGLYTGYALPSGQVAVMGQGSGSTCP